MNSHNVLLIDDEEELVSTLVERLGYRGIEAEFVTNGADGITLMREKKFDAVVLDLKMPGIGGLEVLQILRREHPQVPVLMITGHGSITGNEEVPVGAYEYLPKPINIEAHIEKINEAIGAA